MSMLNATLKRRNITKNVYKARKTRQEINSQNKMIKLKI